jgi:hypothetical protein
MYSRSYVYLSKDAILAYGEMSELGD